LWNCISSGRTRWPAQLALRLDRALPQQVSAGGFSFGHALFGGGTWEVVHFGFAFYGFATYYVLINPSDPVAQTVLKAMVTSGDCFFFALDGDRRTTVFRSSIGKDNLAGLKANIHRIRGSATTDAQHRQRSRSSGSGRSCRGRCCPGCAGGNPSILTWNRIGWCCAPPAAPPAILYQATHELTVLV
jgi:hypothetical protein